jgi:hypothetical protein
MAQIVLLEHPQTGIIKKGFIGYSWTTAWFGGLPALVRGDFVNGIVFTALHVVTGGLGGLVIAFGYNKQYTLRLIDQGYELAGSQTTNALARRKLGIVGGASTAANSR